MTLQAVERASGLDHCECGARLPPALPRCCACLDKRAAEADRAIARLEQRQFETEIATGLRTFPDWALQDADFARKVAPKFLRVVERYEPDRGDLTLLGYTGAGKTLAEAALAKRFAAVAIERRASREAMLVRDSVFVRVAELMRAVRRFPLGRGDCPELARAFDASWLVLDDLGQEHAGFEPTVFEIIDARYANKRHGTSMITHVTSGLTRQQLCARYGDAFFRRLTQPGACVEVW